MAPAHKLALRSLQIGPTETSRCFQKKGHGNPPLAFESSFSNILSRDFTNGDKPPLSLPSLVCCGFLFLWGRRLEGVQEMVEVSLENRRQESRRNSSAQLGTALHQRGFVVRNSRGGVGNKPRLSASQKEVEQALSLSLLGTA